MTLKDFMRWRGMSSRDLAAELGVTQITVNRYVAGTRRPDWEIMERIYNFTGGAVTPTDFLHVHTQDERAA